MGEPGQVQQEVGQCTDDGGHDAPPLLVGPEPVPDLHCVVSHRAPVRIGTMRTGAAHDPAVAQDPVHRIPAGKPLGLPPADHQNPVRQCQGLLGDPRHERPQVLDAVGDRGPERGSVRLPPHPHLEPGHGDGHDGGKDGHGHS